MEIHGLSRTKTYHAWAAMKQRCLNPNHPAFDHYGGRGIKIDPNWMNFSSFYESMGDKPEGLTLDRIDNDGDYAPKNCRWATVHEQSINKRKKNKCGYPCVRRRVKNGKVRFEGITSNSLGQVYLGRFDTAKAAHDAVVKYRAEVLNESC